MLTCIYNFIFDSVRLVLAIFSPSSSCSSYSWNEWSARHFNKLNLVPKSSRLTVH